MRLDLFTQSLKNTASNLGSVLESWESLDESLSGHYVEELLRIVIDIPEARAEAVRQSRLDLLPTIGILSNQIFRLSSEVAQMMGLDLAGLMSPAGTSVPSERGRTDCDQQFAMAA